MVTQYQEHLFYLGSWLVDPTSNTLTKGDQIEQLQPQIMKLLLYLAENHGKVISKDELANAIWPDVVVTNNVLTRTLSRLRTSLGDDHQDPTYIETISKSGYRLLLKPTNEPQPLARKENASPFQLKLSAKQLAISLLVLAAMGGIATLLVGSRLQQKPSIVYQPLPASVLKGGEWDPSISPDGNYMAFAWRGKDNNNWDIYVKLLGTETTIQLTDNESNDRFPFWSPDGKYIGFARYIDNGWANLYKTPSIKNEEVKLTNKPVRCRGNIAFSPDSKYIILNNADSVGPRRIELISLSDDVHESVTTVPAYYLGDYDPKFSSNGELVLFKRARNAVSQDLYLLNLRNNTVEQLTHLGVRIFGHDWLPDEEKILFSALLGGRFTFLQLNLQDELVSTFPINDSQGITPSVSKQGKIAYMKIRDEHNIWSMELDSSSTVSSVKPWLTSSGIDTNPQISPDGEKVVFISNRSGFFEVWTSDRLAENRKQLTHFEGAHVANPRWSRDSKQIAFEVYSNLQSDIYIIDAQGGIPVNLTANDAQDEVAFFSPTEDELFFSSNRSGSWQIWKMKLDTDEISQITSDSGYGAVTDISSKFLYFTKPHSKGLWRQNLPGKKDSLFIPAFDPRYAGNYTFSDSKVYMAMGSPGRLTSYDLATGMFEEVYQMGRYIPQRTNGISISPDFSQILYTQIDENESDIMFFNLTRLEEINSQGVSSEH